MARLLEDAAYSAIRFRDTGGHSAVYIFPAGSGAWPVLIRGILLGSRPDQRKTEGFSRREAEVLSDPVVETSSDLTRVRIGSVDHRGRQSCLLGGAIVDGGASARRGDDMPAAAAGTNAKEETDARDAILQVARLKPENDGLVLGAALSNSLSCEDMAKILACNVILSLDDYSGRIVIRSAGLPKSKAMK